MSGLMIERRVERENVKRERKETCLSVPSRKIISSKVLVSGLIDRRVEGEET